MENIVFIIIRYILGFGLQSFLLVLGIYTFNKQKVILKDYLLTAMLVSIVTYIMKLLPISVGVQTIMNMIFMYLVCVIYLKMQPYKTIRSTSFCVVLILVSEMIVTAIAAMFFGKEQFQIIIGDPSQRYYIGALANIVFAIIIISSYFMLIRKGDYHRSVSEQDS
jgi:hypothetical protein